MLNSGQIVWDDSTEGFVFFVIAKGDNENITIFDPYDDNEEYLLSVHPSLICTAHHVTPKGRKGKLFIGDYVAEDNSIVGKQTLLPRVEELQRYITKLDGQLKKKKLILNSHST